MPDIYVGPYVEVPYLREEPIMRKSCMNKECSQAPLSPFDTKTFCPFCGNKLTLNPTGDVRKIRPPMYEFFEKYFDDCDEYAVSHQKDFLCIIENGSQHGGKWLDSRLDFAFECGEISFPYSHPHWAALTNALESEEWFYLCYWGVVSTNF